MSGMRSELISCEEEERGVKGYEISSHYSPNNQRQKILEIEKNENKITLRYEHNGKITTINKGSRTKSGDRIKVLPFHYCSACNRWLSERGLTEHLDTDSSRKCPNQGAPEDIIRDAWIFLEGNHDTIELKMDNPFEGEEKTKFYTTLKETLLQAIIRTFYLDEGEIDGFTAPDPDDEEQKRIILYEVEEGGIGVLHSLIQKPQLLKVLINNSLDVIHIDPETLREHDDSCSQACYNCLLRYWNQREHLLLDRDLVKDFLIELQNPTITEIDPLTGHLEDLISQTESDFEKKVLYEIKDKGYRLPDEAQKLIQENHEPITRADFFYEPKTCVFVDGPAHDKDYVKSGDQRKRRRIKSLGYRIIVIREINDIEKLKKL
jgi:hypothetical protein